MKKFVPILTTAAVAVSVSLVAAPAHADDYAAGLARDVALVLSPAAANGVTVTRTTLDAAGAETGRSTIAFNSDLSVVAADGTTYQNGVAYTAGSPAGAQVAKKASAWLGTTFVGVSRPDTTTAASLAASNHPVRTLRALETATATDPSYEGNLVSGGGGSLGPLVVALSHLPATGQVTTHELTATTTSVSPPAGTLDRYVVSGPAAAGQPAAKTVYTYAYGPSAPAVDPVGYVSADTYNQVAETVAAAQGFKKFAKKTAKKATKRLGKKKGLKKAKTLVRKKSAAWAADSALRTAKTKGRKTTLRVSNGFTGRTQVVTIRIVGKSVKVSKVKTRKAS
ncbi:hypothetical protein [Nocardioides campestrisoli]|uniref:hypothetical protein n=1 Tax=Nocardioides campestrisoli TaxID=2736757 RepID=UPI00163DC8CF|nr:hypothetical protein [Nocardioides campestrisoli]